MQDRHRRRGPDSAGSVGPPFPGSSRPAVELAPSAGRGAAFERAAADEAAANAARRRYRSRGLEPLEPDGRVGPLLGPGERLLAIRHDAGLDPRQPSASGGFVAPAGDLYVTSERLVHLGKEVRTFDLDDIEDATLDDGRVLLLFHDGLGITVDADRPRLLRVQISTARAARAGSASGEMTGDQASSR